MATWNINGYVEKGENKGLNVLLCVFKNAFLKKKIR